MFLFHVPPYARLGLLVGLLLASKIGLVLGHGSSGRYDILKGTQGESACALKKTIDSKCATSSTRRDLLFSAIHNRDDRAPLVPSICTCNAIFFNIWSACYYSTGNNTLPIFGQWTQNCTKNSINVDSSTQYSEVQGNLGIDVPSWANIGVPGNSTFDIQRAVKSAFSTSIRNQWTTLQKVLPIVAAFVTLLVSGIVILIYQRYQRKLSRSSNRMEWPKGLKRLHLHTSHKVTATIDRDETWEIDGPVANHSPFVNFAPSLDDDMEMTDVHEHDKNPKTVSSLKSTNEKAPTGIHYFRIPTHSRLPWKRRPPHIRFVPATPRFRVDDAKSIFTCSGEAVGGNEINRVAEELVAEDADHVAQNVEETRSLITASERAERDSQEVILISNGGRSFTLESRSENTVSVNSHIKIISPSVSSTSPHSAMYPASAKPKLYMPIPPPPPSHAAPAPPVMPQSLRPTVTERPSDSNRQQSLAHFQFPFLSPIKEASSPAQSFSSSKLRRSPAIRRSSNPESVSESSLHISPAESSNTGVITSTQSPSSHLNHHHRRTRTAPSPATDLSKALGSEDDDFYMENAASTNGQCQGPPPSAADSDTSIASFYYNSQRYPVTLMPASLHSIDPTTLYAGPVRGAGYYSTRTNTQ